MNQVNALRAGVGFKMPALIGVKNRISKSLVRTIRQTLGWEPWSSDYVCKVTGSNPRTVYGMDIFSHWFVAKIVLFAWKDRKETKKRPGFPHLKNSLADLPSTRTLVSIVRCRRCRRSCLSRGSGRSTSLRRRCRRRRKLLEVFAQPLHEKVP